MIVVIELNPLNLYQFLWRRAYNLKMLTASLTIL